MEPEGKKSEIKYGEVGKFDPDFKGPIHKRGCTDIVCCFLFIVALLAYFGVGILAWSQGDPRKILYPTDSKGNFCGQKGTPQENKTFLFYYNILMCASPAVLLQGQCPTTQICVKHCPYKHLTLAEAVKNKDDRDYYAEFCQEGVNSSWPIHILKQYCPSSILASKAFTRRCVPTMSRLKNGSVVVGNNTMVTIDSVNVPAIEVLNATKKSNMLFEARQLAMKIFEDYTQSWHYIIIALTIAMVCSWFFIILLRFLADIMVWVMIVLVIGIVAYGVLHCFLQYQSLRADPSTDVTIGQLGMQPDFAVYLEIRQTWLIFTITLAIVEFLIIATLIFLRKRLMVAIALIKESSRALGYVTSSLFYPLLTSVLLAIVIAYWAVTSVYLATSNSEVYKVSADENCTFRFNTCDPKTFNKTNMSAECPEAECNFAYHGGDTLYHKYITLFQFYNAFLFFWCGNFVTALGQVTLAGAFASYYWAFKKPDDIPPNPVMSSLGRTLRYHTGSVAFGSLVLALVQIIRVILEYLNHKLQGARNKYAKFLLNCMKCCFWCLEKCIKFLNRNAYIMIAIYGKNFCTSAQDAFMLLLRNIARVAVLDKVTDFLLFLGKLLIVGVIGIISFFFFTGRMDSPEYASPTLNYYWVPIMTNIVGSYLIAHGFFSVYSMCVDTLFLCFCEDLERNDGSPERPYYMSPELHDLIGLSRRSEGDGDDADSPASKGDVLEVENIQLQELKMQSNASHANVEDEPLRDNAEVANETNEQTRETEEQTVSEDAVLEKERSRGDSGS
ncbi:choline transporter-like protein 2 isoform X1 [Syngnathus scovelli]|uniref:choline transporter-like protein 2 isoform X1 n=1 Tax=Syngnathus scovelli TaxID=161590 RepID=UPI00210F2929|nr:choline transporter-like protein 2 isoform X1 [Syngnathus scovelli]